MDEPGQGERQHRVWQWRQETLGLFWFAHGKVKDGCGIWATPEASFPPFFPILLSLSTGFVLFLTLHWLNTMKAFISLFFLPVWNVEREKVNLGYCIERFEFVLWWYVAGWDFILRMQHSAWIIMLIGVPKMRCELPWMIEMVSTWCVR